MLKELTKDERHSGHRAIALCDGAFVVVCKSEAGSSIYKTSGSMQPVSALER